MSMLEKLSNYLAYKWLLSWSFKKVTCYCVFVYGMWVILKNVFHGKMMTWMDWFKKCCWYANLLKVKFGLLQKNRKHFGNLNYLLILFTKSILYFKFQPYSILAQVLKVEYIAIRFWCYNIEDITLEWNLVHINYDSIFLLPRIKVHSTGFSRWIWIHFPPISFVFKGKLCLAHQKQCIIINSFLEINTLSI